MMMACLSIAIFLTLFAGNVNALSDWQVTVPEKEHVASYQIVCDDWKIHYVVNIRITIRYFIGWDMMNSLI